MSIYQVINKKTFDQFETQKIFQEQKNQIQTTIKKLQEELQMIHTSQPPQEHDNQEVWKNSRRKPKKRQKISRISQAEIEYKSIENIYAEYINQDKQAKELDKKISELEQESKQKTRKLRNTNSDYSARIYKKAVKRLRKSYHTKKTTRTKNIATRKRKNGYQYNKTHSKKSRNDETTLP